MAVRIMGTFSKDTREYNGLEGIEDDLCERMLDKHVVVATIETRRVIKDSDGTHTPVVRFLQIEPLDNEAADAARALLDAAYSVRTGAPAPQPSLFDAPQPEPGDREPDAGPWPGDPEYPVNPPAALMSAEADAVDEEKPKRRRKATDQPFQVLEGGGSGG